MLNDFNCTCPVYLVSGRTDMRSGMDRLASLVQTKFNPAPFQSALFLFCGRCKSKIKALYWESNGFV